MRGWKERDIQHPAAGRGGGKHGDLLPVKAVSKSVYSAPVHPSPG